MTSTLLLSIIDRKSAELIHQWTGGIPQLRLVVIINGQSPCVCTVEASPSLHVHESASDECVNSIHKELETEAENNRGIVRASESMMCAAMAMIG